MNGGLLQRNLSKVFPNKLAVSAAEIFLLLLAGAIAITLHSRLRMPLHIPGRQGLFFIAIIMAASYFSKYSFAASVSCFGAAILLYFNMLGYNDPFMPLVYMVVGVIIDVLTRVSSKISKSIFILAMAAGLGWASIPLIRMALSLLTGFPFHSLASGLLFPVFTHFVSGYAGAVVGLSLSILVTKNKK